MFSVHIIIIYRYVLEKYYTDWQDVDEDARTIIDHGGHDTYGNFAGVACRHMYDIRTKTYGHVASRLIYLS